MDSTQTSQPSIALPSVHLRNFVSHYWLSGHNMDSQYAIQPDGAVDIVFNIGPNTHLAFAYGTSTSITDIPLDIGNHYLGICFKPGKSRHFIDTAAFELTDTCEALSSLLKFELPEFQPHQLNQHIFSTLDQLLEQHLKRCMPAASRIDQVIDFIDSHHGLANLTQCSSIVNKSVRQFERDFKQTVGISAKLYAQIIRFQRASQLISNTDLPLSRIAAELGYSDQSHMSHTFKRFANRTPSSYTRQGVVFLQD